VLRKALGELRMWGLQRSFQLAELQQQQAAAAGAPGSSAKRARLVHGWREVLTEVGDHQGLVASLRQSPYCHLFKVRMSCC
jgi:hypothetical protein